MTTNVEIKCINKIPRHDPNESITHVGGLNRDGSAWKLSLADAIRGIENKEYQFYVLSWGQIVNVIISISRAGNKYLRTESDSSTNNNLLSLPECN